MTIAHVLHPQEASEGERCSRLLPSHNHQTLTYHLLALLIPRTLLIAAVHSHSSVPTPSLLHLCIHHHPLTSHRTFLAQQQHAAPPLSLNIPAIERAPSPLPLPHSRRPFFPLTPLRDPRPVEALRLPWTPPPTPAYATRPLQTPRATSPPNGMPSSSSPPPMPRFPSLTLPHCHCPCRPSRPRRGGGCA